MVGNERERIWEIKGEIIGENDTDKKERKCSC